MDIMQYDAVTVHVEAILGTAFILEMQIPDVPVINSGRIPLCCRCPQGPEHMVLGNKRRSSGYRRTPLPLVQGYPRSPEVMIPSPVRRSLRISLLQDHGFQASHRFLQRCTCALFRPSNCERKKLTGEPAFPATDRLPAHYRHQRARPI